MIERAGVSRPPMSNVSAIRPAAAGTERSVTGPGPEARAPAEHPIETGVAALPGSHQPAHAPDATRTCRAPRIIADRSNVTLVGAIACSPRASTSAPPASNRYRSHAPGWSVADRGDVNGRTSTIAGTYATRLSRTHRPASVPDVSRSHVPVAGRELRTDAVTATGRARVTVRRVATRQAASNVTPVCGPASSRTLSEAARTGAAAGPPATTPTSSTPRTRKGTGARRFWITMATLLMRRSTAGACPAIVTGPRAGGHETVTPGTIVPDAVTQIDDARSRRLAHAGGDRSSWPWNNGRGGVPERSIGAVLNTVGRKPRGFESHPRRQTPVRVGSAVAPGARLGGTPAAAARRWQRQLTPGATGP